MTERGLDDHRLGWSQEISPMTIRTLETVCRPEHHPFTYYYRQLRVLAARDTPALGNIATKPTMQC